MKKIRLEGKLIPRTEKTVELMFTVLCFAAIMMVFNAVIVVYGLIKMEKVLLQKDINDQ